MGRERKKAEGKQEVAKNSPHVMKFGRKEERRYLSGHGMRLSDTAAHKQTQTTRVSTERAGEQYRVEKGEEGRRERVNLAQSVNSQSMGRLVVLSVMRRGEKRGETKRARGGAR